MWENRRGLYGIRQIIGMTSHGYLVDTLGRIPMFGSEILIRHLMGRGVQM